MEDGFVGQIKAAIKRVENTSDHVGGHSFSTQAKLRCLKHMLIRAEVNQKWIKPHVFVSYTGRKEHETSKEHEESKGYKIMLAVMRSLGCTNAPGTNTVFHGTTGMDQYGDGKPEVLEHIVEKLRPCALFIGILTREWEIAAKEGWGGFGPGGWALIETGMAFSLGLKPLLFVDKGINEDFWRPYSGDLRHVTFDAYEKSLGTLMKRTQEAYRALRERKH